MPAKRLSESLPGISGSLLGLEIVHDCAGTVYPPLAAMTPPPTTTPSR